MTTPSSGPSSAGPSSAGPGGYQDSFVAKVRKFMVSNAEVFNTLTQSVTSDLSPHRHARSNYYGDPLPLEYVMDMSTDLSQERLMQLLSPGDIVRGHVILKTPLALGVRITLLVSNRKVRELSQLDIRGLVKRENLAAERSRREEVLKEMEVDDVVQAVVISKQECSVSISFSSDHVTQLCPSSIEGGCLGYMERESVVSARKRPVSTSLFLSDLEELTGFNNPCSSGNLRKVLGVEGYHSEARPSLMKGILSACYPQSDYFHCLRKAQRRKWSLDTVGVGVKHFKKGDLDKAKKLLNHALDIDATNVEGLVARGALYANAGRYSEAIVDFETALTIHHTHKNARKYLVETRVVYGEELEKEGRLERAVVCYQEAVADDPSQESAKSRLEVLKKVLEKKAAEKLERERKEAAEKARLKKLHSLIKQEKEKKTKKKRKKKSTVRMKKSRIKKVSRHKRYSTSSEDSTSDSDLSARHYDYSRPSLRHSNSPYSKGARTRGQYSKGRRSRSRSSSTLGSKGSRRYSLSRHRSRSERRSRSRSRSERRSRSRSRSERRSRSRSRSERRSRSRSRSERSRSRSKRSRSRSERRSRSRSRSERRSNSRSRSERRSRSRSRSERSRSRSERSRSQHRERPWHREGRSLSRKRSPPNLSISPPGVRRGLNSVSMKQ